MRFQSLQKTLIVMLGIGFIPCSSLLAQQAGEKQTTSVSPANDPDLQTRRHVTIATLGPQPLAVDSKAEPQQIVERMIGHWRKELGQVLTDKPDLIVLPECCDRPSGLSEDKVREYYRVRGDQIQNALAEIAGKNHCYVVYSANKLQADSSWRNACVLLDRQGRVVGEYHKNHPTIGEIEDNIRPGREAKIFECDFGRVAFAICFDLNFDELRLQYARLRPDLIIFCSMYHGGMMQPYWAYSCRSHFVGAVSGLPCEIYNPLGEKIGHSTNYFDFAVTTVNLDCRLAHLDYNWDRLRRMKEKYGPAVIVTDPGFLGSVLISSRHPALTADQIVKEFEIELLDDYLNRARVRQKQEPLPKEEGDKP